LNSDFNIKEGANVAAPKNNQFWKARTKHGRDKLFSSPEVLWNACVEYFEWVDSNPLWEDRAFSFKGIVTHEPVKKMRAMTITGLCLFLGTNHETWRRYRSDKDFNGIMAQAESIIYVQKFEGAAADLLNPNIIARDLGLKESSTVTHNFRSHEDALNELEQGPGDTGSADFNDI
jgi:hypothetical protein